MEELKTVIIPIFFSLSLSLSLPDSLSHTPLCRLESIIRSLSMKKLSKPVILVRPKLDLKFQPQFSDLSLISEEGESIPCHRCVLVARSGMLQYTILLNMPAV